MPALVAGPEPCCARSSDFDWDGNPTPPVIYRGLGPNPVKQVIPLPTS
jgi:hypothetical protein